MHKNEQKTTSKTEREDDNNFLHRGESVAAYLYCRTAKVQDSWPHYFYNRIDRNNVSTLVIGYDHRMSWDMRMLITYCVRYSALVYRPRFGSEVIT